MPRNKIIFFCFFLLFVSIARNALFDNIKIKKQDDFINEFTSEKPTKVYSKSHRYVVNNNLAQYSVYLYKYGDLYKIDAFVIFNLKNVNEDIRSINDLKNHLKLENYLCFVKFLDLKGDDKNEEEVIRLNAVEIQQYFYKDNAKLTFQFYPEKKFNIENIAIGVIYKNDYSNAKFNYSFTNSEKIMLPYSLINYQVPIQITKNDKLGKSVGTCVHFTLDSVPSFAQNWVDIHLSLGIAEIMLYDSTSDVILTKAIKKDKRVSIKPYRINVTDFCDDTDFFTKEYSAFGEILKRNCLNFYNLEFKELIEAKHAQLTSNDCYFQLSQKHEYVAYFDLDEFLMPRTFASSFDCNKYKICSLKPFGFDRQFDEANLFYNYLENLIEKYRKNQNKSMLSSIMFRHAAYVISNNITEKLFDDLSVLVEKFHSNKFPYTINIATENGHKFIVGGKDFGHVKNLVQSYKISKNCSFGSINSKLDKTLQRHIYFLTDPEQGLLKSVYFSKNVNSLFNNDIAKNTWTLVTNPKDGHRLVQFRHQINDWTHNQINTSITNLNIDYEYFTFALKEFTDYC